MSKRPAATETGVGPHATAAAVTVAAALRARPLAMLGVSL